MMIFMMIQPNVIGYNEGSRKCTGSSSSPGYKDLFHSLDVHKTPSPGKVNQ